MKGILIGAMHKQGTFTDDNTGNAIEYDNIVLILQKPIELVHNKDRMCTGVGYTTIEAKAPWSSIGNLFDGKISDINELGDYIGLEISYFFDDKKKLDTIML